MLLNEVQANVGGESLPVAYAFLAVSTSGTITGFYTSGEHVVQNGVAFSLAVPVANGTNDPVVLPSVPSDAMGAVLFVPVNLYWGLCNGDTSLLADLKTNYAMYPKILADPEFITIGRA